MLFLGLSSQNAHYNAEYFMGRADGSAGLKSTRPHEISLREPRIRGQSAATAAVAVRASSMAGDPCTPVRCM